MQFDSIGDFFAMGGYGFYVWLSFGATFLCLGLLTLHTLLTRRKLRSEALRQVARAERIMQARAARGKDPLSN